MAEAATGFLLESLKEQVFQTVLLHQIAGSELEALKKDLEGIKKDLENASKKKSGEKFRDIESRILEVIYEAEDLIDTNVTNELNKKRKRDWKDIFQPSKADLADNIQKLRKEKLIPVFRDCRKDLKELPMLSVASDRELKKRRQYVPDPDKALVGMEDELKKYIETLLEPGDRIEARSIVGMPGLGKTTVASNIYQDEHIKHHFPTRGWINVSQNPSMTEVYKSIIRIFTQSDVSQLNDPQLAQKARTHLASVKFLLVFDDVWKIEDWKDIEEALPMVGGSGKVLITTRFDVVAKHANPHREEKDLRFLKPDECWTLLQLQVYRGEKKWPADSELLGRQICEKSGGLPLAIVVIGGILVNKIFPEEKRVAEWEKIAATAENYMLKDDKAEGLNSIIALSYNTMPYDLRDCFIYLGICPKDFEMSTWKLKRLWIAEGFIKEDRVTTKTLEDIAEEKLMDLITMNLVMVAKTNDRGDVKKCRVHDMIREFCKANAMNLLQVVEKSPTGFCPDNEVLEKSRPICVHSHLLEFLKEQKGCHKLRSFISFSKKVTDAETTIITTIAQAFKLLRVLEGSSIKFPKYEPKLTSLVHLRYITLSVGETFQSLPKNVGEAFVNLQTIVIVSSQTEFKIMADIFEMPRLRHVKSNATLTLIVSTPNKTGESNKKLQTLTRLSAGSCNEKMLRKSRSLKTLGISGNICLLPENADFRSHSNLRKLKLINSVSFETPIAHLLDENKFPPRLEVLVLSETNLHWSYMSVIGRLKYLRTLKIKDNACVGDEWKVGHGEFTSLRHLELERSDLLLWSVDGVSFGSISSLCVRNCLKLLAIPAAVAKSLKKVRMGNVSGNAVTSALSIKAEYRVEVLLDAGTYIPN